MPILRGSVRSFGPFVLLGGIGLLGACGGSGVSSGSGGGGGGGGGPLLVEGPVFALGTRAPFDVAIGDLDETGSLDLVVADRGNDQIIVILNPVPTPLGPPAATIFLPATTGPDQVAIADIDQDGHMDVVCNGTTGAAGFFRGHGAVGLDSVASAGGTVPFRRFAVADFDGDGLPDLMGVVRPVNSDEIRFFKGSGNGSFQGSVLALALAEGASDLLVGNISALATPELFVVWGPGGNVIGGPPGPLLYLRDFGSNQPAKAIPLSEGVLVAAIHDMDGDGLPDLVGSANAGAGAVAVTYLSTGGIPTLADVTGVGTALTLPAPGDFDGQGDPDLVEVGIDGAVSLWRASGGTFVKDPAVAYALSAGNVPFRVVAADLDGDGHDDVVVADVDNVNGTANFIRVYLGNR